MLASFPKPLAQINNFTCANRKHGSLHILTQGSYPVQITQESELFVAVPYTCIGLPSDVKLVHVSSLAHSPSCGTRNWTFRSWNSTGLQARPAGKRTGQEQMRQGANHRAAYRYKLSFLSCHFTNAAIMKKGPAQCHKKRVQVEKPECRNIFTFRDLFSPWDHPIKIPPPYLQVW